MAKLPNKWGYLNKTKWVLIEKAPLSVSGLNEILFAAHTRKALVEIARIFGYKLSSRYTIVKLEDIKENTHGNTTDAL